MPDIFHALLVEQIQGFRRAFLESTTTLFINPETGDSRHPGEHGTYREAITRDFMRKIIPQRLGIGSGFVIASTGDISTQCDIVVYDQLNTPVLESAERQRFYPVESVCGIGEVKSIIRTIPELAKTLNKLARVKHMRRTHGTPIPVYRDRSLAAWPYNPVANAYDHAFSFIVCAKLPPNLHELTSSEGVGSLYEPTIEVVDRHNFILGIEDGLCLYYDHNRKSMMYPFIKGQSLKSRLVKPGEDLTIHLRYFASYLSLLATSATTLHVDLVEYGKLGSGGMNYDEV